MAIIFDWPDFLVKLLAIMGLFFVAGILLGIGLLGLIMRDERRERHEMQHEAEREIEAYEAQEKALWAEVDRILSQGDEGGDHVGARS